MSMHRSALLLSTSVALALLAIPAAAQQSTTAPVAGDAATTAQTAGEDVVVTANKRAQSALDVAQSLTVVSGAALENQHASSIQDYLKDIPGLQLNQSTPGFGRLVIRGINTGGVAATVGVYVDETPFGSSSSLANGAILAGDFDTFDVARIEVLRGPQGTLYGSSSLSGVLKFVTSDPETDKYVVRGRAGVETVRGGSVSYYGNAVINVPLAETLAFRASGTYRKDGGFIDTLGAPVRDGLGNTLIPPARNDINGTRTYGGRAALLFTPSTAFSIKLSAIVQNIENDGSNLVDANANTLETLNGRPTQTQFVPSTSKVTYRVYNGLVSYDAGFATLTSSSSYSKLKQDFHTDLTYNLGGYLSGALKTPLQAYLAQTTGVERYSEEVRLASSKSPLFDWLLGGYYNHERGTLLQRYVPVTPGTLNEITALPTLAQVNLSSRYEEVAGFADGTVHLGHMIDVDLGVRYSHNSQSADQVQSGALVGGTTVYPHATSSEGVFTYSAAPKLKLTDHASIYARVAKGFRPGGPNVLAPPAAGTTTPAGTPGFFNSDTLVSYEGGFKGETPDRKFAIEVAGYHIDWDRIQLFAIVNNFGLTVNGVGAKSDGVEFTTTFRPTAGLDLSVNGAFTRARLDGDPSSLVGARSGDQLPFTPKESIGVNGDYRWSLGSRVTASAGASLRFLSKQTGSYDGTYRATYGRQRQIPSYDIVDLRAGLDFGRFGLDAYVRNLLDADGKTSIASLTANGLPNLPNGAIGAGIIRPRTVGLSLTASY